MPQRSKGARLWLEPAHQGRRAVWVIRDGRTKCSTGFRPGELEEAQAALAKYILAKSGAARIRNRDPDQVRIADVIAIYAADVAPRHANPAATAAILKHLLDFFGREMLSYLNKRSCMAYEAARGRSPSARRELETMRAALRYHHQAGLSWGVAPVTLPEKSPPRERWLTRSEAARLIWAAWRHKDGTSGARNMQYVARFILMAIYTGTRAGAICKAAMGPTKGCGFVDLERGVFYRRGAGERETKKRQPPVRLPPRLQAHLRRWKRKRLAISYVIESAGRPIARINDGFRVVRIDAGMRDVTPHTLRHTCATWLAQAGVSVWEAAGYLGMTAATFESVYGHHHPDHQAQAVAAFGRRDAPAVEGERKVLGMWKGNRA